MFHQVNIGEKTQAFRYVVRSKWCVSRIRADPGGDFGDPLHHNPRASTLDVARSSLERTRGWGGIGQVSGARAAKACGRYNCPVPLKAHVGGGTCSFCEPVPNAVGDCLVK
jgi:hypothetical protein